MCAATTRTCSPTRSIAEGSHSPADVLLHRELAAARVPAEHKGLLAPVDRVDAGRTPARYNSPQGDWVGVSARVSVLVYNPTLIKQSAAADHGARSSPTPSTKASSHSRRARPTSSRSSPRSPRPTGRREGPRWLNGDQGERRRPHLPRQRDDRRRGQPRARSRSGSSTSTTGTGCGRRSAQATCTRRSPTSRRATPAMSSTSRAPASSSPRAPGRCAAVPRFPGATQGQEIIAALDQLRVPARRRACTPPPASAVRQLAAEPDRPSPSWATVATAHRSAAARRSCCDGARRGRPGRRAVAGDAGRAAARPSWLLGRQLVVAVLLLLPLVFLVIEAAAGRRGRRRGRCSTAPSRCSLLWNTVRLTVAVTALCAVIGTVAAWLVEAHQPAGPPGLGRAPRGAAGDPRLRRQLRVGSLSPGCSGFRGAVLVMTLAVYPLVYLPVAASLRKPTPPGGGRAQPRAGPAADVLAGHAGAGPRGHPRRLPAGRAGPPGRVRGVRDPRLTRPSPPRSSPSSRVGFDTAAGVRPVAGARRDRPVVLAGEGAVAGQGRGEPSRSGPWPQRVTRPPRARPGHQCRPGWPLGARGTRPRRARAAVVYWMVQGGGTIDAAGGASLVAPPGTPPLYSARRRPLATLRRSRWPSWPVRHPGRRQPLSSAAPSSCWRCPAWSSHSRSTYFTEQLRRRACCTRRAPLLVAAYAILFFPLALVGVRASVAQAPAPAGGGGPQSLGVGAPRACFSRVTLPLVAPGWPPRSASCSSPPYRADRHPDPRADRRADPGHPVLGLPDKTSPTAQAAPFAARHDRSSPPCRATCSAASSTGSLRARRRRRTRVDRRDGLEAAA